MPASRVTGAPDAAPGTAAPVPSEFLEVVAALSALRVRPEIELSELPAPQRLAPHAHAIAATVHDTVTDIEIGSGRFVILYDPEGVASWGGTLRFVIFATCDVEGEIARDPLLPDVGWSWLTESLDGCGAEHTALGGTVTATSSVRFGDIAGTERSDDVEIRASWTGVEGPWARHLAAFTGLLAVAAGLPPEGVAPIGPIRPGSRA
ncbi:DUF3000 domain-containing protein [Nakamurella deserti]|uniref:DUF3000 domain-containing protein n=1 Tax=Nakamurella deserti TaxID=2164074 RepID=UPI000DBE6673|nr:DUF3000 domain-containing protein [Nakamurella deserti]